MFLQGHHGSIFASATVFATIFMSTAANPLSPIGSSLETVAKRKQIGGLCGVNSADSSQCTDPNFPYCVCNYYVPSMDFPRLLDSGSTSVRARTRGSVD